MGIVLEDRRAGMKINVILKYSIIVRGMDRPDLFMELLYKRIILVGYRIITLSRPRTLKVRNMINGIVRRM